MRSRFPSHRRAAPGLSMRWRVVAAMLLAALLTGWFALPALAHATLTTATPGDASVVERAPTVVTLTYDEAVGLQNGAVKVLAPDGTRVDTGEATTGDGGRSVTAPLQPGLARGTYTILWRVLSEDSHSIFGASTFSVGQPSATVAGAAVEAEAGGGDAAKRLLGVGRLLLYAGLVLLFGGLAFLVTLWPPGRAAPRVVTILRVGWVSTVVASVADLLLQGPYTAGLSLGSALDPVLLANVLETRFGVATVIRLLLLTVVAVLLRRLDRMSRPALSLGTAVLGVGVMLTVSALGHSGAGDLVVVAMAADALHLAAMSYWLGGLVLLGLVVLTRHPLEAAAMLPRWSSMAATAVCVLVVTGTFTAWRQVRQLDALVSTEYGVLLLVKLGVVAVVMGLAVFSRALVRRRLGGRVGGTVQPSAGAVTAAPALVYADGSTASTPSGGSSGPVETACSPAGVDTAGPVDTTPATDGPVTGSGLRRSVVVEAVLAAVVLGVTSALVATTPARDTYFPVFEQTVAATDALQVDITVDPARTGLNDLSFSYSADSRPVDVVKVSTRWTSEDGTYVVPAELTRAATGEYRFSGLLLPSAGTWKLAVTTQTSDIDTGTVVLAVPIR
ncbi:copper resistance CopC/CopD family protein [Nakamurella deserti]|uniref:copper resistance CopC/CopD family protein n=1 Tax=Nakamurella deserti TaxID=2164074 RepID=UPI00130020A9|nr:copper resistance protein CopC [Nakamurella deserti]